MLRNVPLGKLQPDIRFKDESLEQRALSRFNRQRLAPGLGQEGDGPALILQQQALTYEKRLLAHARSEIAPALANVARDPGDFAAWFQNLELHGPGQNDPLFPWLAEEATLEDMRWFLTQEVAGEAGFDDLVAMTQVKMPVRAKLEMARNYWDEMGRGDPKGMHGPMLDQLVRALAL